MSEQDLLQLTAEKTADPALESGGERPARMWSAAVLHKRGWTDPLLRELLPPPRYRTFNGRRVRQWPRPLVQEAENTPAFRQAQAQPEPPAPQAPRQKPPAKGTGETSRPGSDLSRQALQAALDFLRQSWQEHKPELIQEEAIGENQPERLAAVYDNQILRLASLYHQAFIRQLPALTWAERIKPGQAMSYIEHFLAICRRPAAVALSSELKHFLTAAPWLGHNLGSRSAQRLYEGYVPTLLALARRSLADFRAAQPEADLHGLLDMADFPARELISHPLNYIYSVFYVPQAIRTSLQVLMALNPKDEYPRSRALQRRFVLHIGGTNTGKTYAGFQRLAEAKTGVYLAPLRLLALEAQELLLDRGVACSLTTGEEEDCQEGDTHVAATAEKLDLSAHFQVAVIDECQMIVDRERGYAWTRAILGVLAPEVHLCAAPEAEGLLLRLIASCGEECTVVRHQRRTPLICLDKPLDYSNLQPGDALITFSKLGVLSVAEDLRSRGKEPAIIYGALPYATRRKQMEGFLSGRMQYVVATDAIGMGLNLPIRRIIFMETEKFDGVERRELRPHEVQQIAGRAGRFGMYDKGYVGATQSPDFITAAMHTVTPPLDQAVVGFSDLVLSVDFDLLEVLEVWNRMPTVEPYVKLDVSRYIFIISKLREQGFRLSKTQELAAANIPFDETDEELYRLFTCFLSDLREGEELQQPRLSGKLSRHTLPELEQHYRKLDLYFSFAKAFGCAIDREELALERELIADQINQILLHNLRNNIRFCPACGAALPLYHQGRLCDHCYRRKYGTRYHK